MKLDKILFIHPSRGRAGMALEAVDNIVGTMRSGVAYSYCISIDTDDPELAAYHEMAAEKKIRIIVNDNPHQVVDATNRAAETLQDEDIIFAQTDDYRWQDGWDVPFLAFARTLPEMALINYPDYRADIACPQILSRALYKRLGYVFWREYLSQFADNDILEVARKLGCLYELRPIPFVHVHPAFGRRPMDATTERANSGHNSAHDLAIFNKRRNEGFNL